MLSRFTEESKKCLVLDLDNTLWGGIIGDDGVQNLILGRDHPVGEAFLDFQRYVKDLQRRGVILAVCSKNDPENAKEGFSHPDSILKLEDFSAFKANWNPKPENLREIAAELNIGLDSLVFVDDNPAERALVADQLPEVAVPDVGSDVSRFAEVLEHERYFEVDKVVQDDLNRSAYYNSNAQRSTYQAGFRNYGEFLASLEMTAEIGPFSSVYLERITQLINKTNQFNLTTKRYTSAEVEAISRNPGFITLYGRLADRFGDNGLVSVLIGCVTGETVEVDLWLMSCRVLNREMEFAMFDALVEQCQARGIRRIVGVYSPSKKNSMVAGHYAGLGFTRVSESSGDQELWHYDVPQPYSARTRFIRRTAASRLPLRMLEEPLITRTSPVQLASREKELKFMQNHGWQVEVDRATPAEWSQMLDLFDDANIYQTSAYGGVRWGEKNLSRLVLKRDGEVLGMAQLRIVRPTPLKFGMAYLRWGPLWERRGLALDPEVPNCMARAVEDEYVRQEEALSARPSQRLCRIVARHYYAGCIPQIHPGASRRRQHVPDFCPRSQSLARRIAKEPGPEMAK